MFLYANRKPVFAGTKTAVQSRVEKPYKVYIFYNETVKSQLKRKNYYKIIQLFRIT